MKKTLSVLLVTATSLSTMGMANAQENTTASGSALKAGIHRAFSNGAAAHADFTGKRPERLPVDTTVEKLANGVAITRTSTDADTVKKIQERAAQEVSDTTHRPADLKDVQITNENLANGVKTTMTSTDAATVTKLQNHENGPRGGHPGGFEPLQNVEFTKENITNGVVLKRTSTDADTVKKLQEQEAKMQANKPADDANRPGKPALENVQVTVTNIDNGVQTTLTSTDAATVTKLQAMPEKPMMMLPRGGKGGFGGHGGKAMDKETTQE